jgi:hypothetical protein
MVKIYRNTIVIYSNARMNKNTTLNDMVQAISYDQIHEWSVESVEVDPASVPGEVLEHFGVVVEDEDSEDGECDGTLDWNERAEQDERER